MQRNRGESPRQTKVVATLGRCPDADWPTFLERMADAGADVFRLNFSHASEGYENEKAILEWAHQPVADRHAPRVAILGDLQGPKARIGRLPEAGLTLADGQDIALRPSDEATEHIPIPELTFNAVVDAIGRCQEGNEDAPIQIVLGDGDIVLDIQKMSDQEIEARVVFGATLSSNKGITVRGADIDLDPFSPKDQQDLTFCLDHGVDLVAVSFVRTAADIQRVRAFVEEHTGNPDAVGIVAKIETYSGTQEIESIVQETDGIMIARGDLGVQLGVERVPGIQKHLAQTAKRRGKAVIVATQMLESMIDNPTPTRAEATDVFNAILDGSDAVMLSAETSIGKRPIEVVTSMDTIARHAETYRAHPAWLKHDRKSQREAARSNVGDPFVGSINEEFALTAVQFAEHIPARAVICFTRSGGTPRRLSQYRPAVPLLAVCNQEAVARRLLLHYGVHPVVVRAYSGSAADFGTLVADARETLRRDYHLDSGDAIVVTAGMNWPRGGTNIIRVMVEDLETN